MMMMIIMIIIIIIINECYCHVVWKKRAVCIALFDIC